MAYKPLELMTKAELLVELEQNTPQGYWPPRPTRQDKATIFKACLRARDDRVANARREAAYKAANLAHPLPISGSRP